MAAAAGFVTDLARCRIPLCQAGTPVNRCVHEAGGPGWQQQPGPVPFMQPEPGMQPMQQQQGPAPANVRVRSFPSLSWRLRTYPNYCL